MDEAEYCNRVALMYSGRVIALGSPAELKQHFGERHLLMLETPDLLGAMRALQGRKEIVDVAVFGSGLHVTAGASGGMDQIRGVLDSAGIQVSNLEPIPPSMEDVFVGLIEEQERAHEKANDKRQESPVHP
jgi:ABC-2 type transport system ATP-binding protein